MELPQRVSSILAADETVEQRFRLSDTTVYTTDRRLIEHSRRSVVGYDYADIRAVSRTTRRFRWLLVPGIVVAVAGGIGGYYGMSQSVVMESFGLAAAGGALAAGLILGAVGVMARSERLDISLAGAPSNVVYRGPAGRLQGLTQSIRQRLAAVPPAARQRRVAAPPVARRSDAGNAVIGFTSTLALLADLRDKGGISREGFERLEQEVRRGSVPVRPGGIDDTEAGSRPGAGGGAAGGPGGSPRRHDEVLQPAKSEILTVLASDASHGAFDGAGSLAEAATRAGASTHEIAEALGVPQFTRGIGNLYRSSTALRELAVATGSSTGWDAAR